MTTERDALAQRLYRAYIGGDRPTWEQCIYKDDWLRVADAALAERSGGEVLDGARWMTEAEWREQRAAILADRDRWQSAHAVACESYAKMVREQTERASRAEALLRRWLDRHKDGDDVDPEVRADTRAFLSSPAATGQAGAWSPKVGERVRVRGGSVGEVVDTDCPEPYSVRVSFGVHGTSLYAPAELRAAGLPPAPQPDVGAMLPEERAFLRRLADKFSFDNTQLGLTARALLAKGVKDA